MVVTTTNRDATREIGSRMTHPKKPKHHKRKEQHMPGTGGINNKRPAVEFWYDGSSHPVDIPVTVTFVNAESGQVGQKKDKNDGLVTATYKAGSDLDDTVTVTSDEDGSVIAEFDVHVHVAD